MLAPSSSRVAKLADGKLRLDEPAAGVARLTISNPAKRNALDHAMLDAIAQVVPTLDLACLVITGSERMVSAGFDIGGISSDVLAEDAEKLVANRFAAAIEALESYPYPTLAVLNGHAIGGGLEVAVSCDLRIAATGVRVGMPPAKLGLVYPHTGLRKFIDTIGIPRTRELFFVGRNVDAETAAGWGLINTLVEPDALERASLDLAREIAGNAPLSLTGHKRAISEVIKVRGELDPEVERELVALHRSCLGSADLQEGVRAFAEKRKPRWKGR